MLEYNDLEKENLTIAELQDIITAQNERFGRLAVEAQNAIDLAKQIQAQHKDTIERYTVLTNQMLAEINALKESKGFWSRLFA